MKITLNSFSADKQFHTGFYSKDAYRAFKKIFAECNRHVYTRSFYVFQNAMGEVVICTYCNVDYERQWWGINWHQGITLQECMKQLIVKFADVVKTYAGCDLSKWANDEDPLDPSRFKKLVGTPENPIKAELNDLLLQEEAKLAEKFDWFRDEIYNRRFRSYCELFAIDPKSARGCHGYSQNVTCAKYLPAEALEKLYSQESDMHEALQKLIEAAAVYKDAHAKWHGMNNEITHLLTVAKNKELNELRKSMKAAKA